MEEWVQWIIGTAIGLGSLRLAYLSFRKKPEVTQKQKVSKNNLQQSPVAQNIHNQVNNFGTEHKPGLGKVELIHAKIDTSVCNWKQNEGDQRVFVTDPKGLSESPVFDFTFFNHFSKAIVLTKVKLRLKFFEPGMKGPYEPPEPVKPYAKYVFEISDEKEYYSYYLQDPVRIAPQEAFRFQVELLFPGKLPLKDRHGLYFTFVFNNQVEVAAPVILLNSDNEEGLFKNYTLH